MVRAAQEPLPLVVLATRHGSVAKSDTASFAQGLLEHDIPMVLAMQSTVSDWYATRLAGTFYGHLARRDVRLPSYALALARQDVEKERREALRQGQGGALSIPEYATPSLFCAGDEIPLLDWERRQAGVYPALSTARHGTRPSPQGRRPHRPPNGAARASAHPARRSLGRGEIRKLLYRLTELKGQPPVVLGKILRLIGGHPRVLEYLDAILHKGTGRLSIVEEKLRENVNRMGLRVEDLGGNLEQSLQDAIRIGAQDIFLDELLDVIVGDPGDREILGQASVFPMPIDLHGLALALSDVQEPSAERIGAVREAAARLVGTSLLIPLEEDSVWVHRWTAEALKKRNGPLHSEYCRRAGEFFLWRLRTASHSLIDAIEGVRLLCRPEPSIGLR